VVIPKKEILMDYVSKSCDFAKKIFERLMYHCVRGQPDVEHNRANRQPMNNGSR